MLFPPQPPEPPEQQRERERACHREALHDLVILGINTAKALERRAIASANEGTNAVIDAAIAFERIARAIRRTIALARHIATNPPKTRTQTVERTQAREKIIRGVEDAIEARRAPTTETATLYNELNERLDDAAFERDLRTRPLDDIIEELARDLGVASQSRAWVWKRRTPVDIATFRARAARTTNATDHQNNRSVGFSPQPPPPPKQNKRWAEPP